MRILIALAFILLAAPAFAALAPEYYAQARAEAPSVIVISVLNTSPPPARGYGECLVRGSVAAVERGDAYTVGQEVSLAVPCMRAGASIPAGPVQWQDWRALRTSPYGRAWLTAEGTLALYQYEVLSALP